MLKIQYLKRWVKWEIFNLCRIINATLIYLNNPRISGYFKSTFERYIDVKQNQKTSKNVKSLLTFELSKSKNLHESSLQIIYSHFMYFGRQFVSIIVRFEKCA